MTDKAEQWVLEWSAKQNAFHIQLASWAEEKNLNNLLDNRGHDYIMICIGSREKCDKQAARFRKLLVEREMTIAAR